MRKISKRQTNTIFKHGVWVWPLGPPDLHPRSAGGRKEPCPNPSRIHSCPALGSVASLSDGSRQKPLNAPRFVVWTSGAVHTGCSAGACGFNASFQMLRVAGTRRTMHPIDVTGYFFLPLCGTRIWLGGGPNFWDQTSTLTNLSKRN